MPRIVQASTPGRIAQVRQLFQEYGRDPEIRVCLQGFEQELASLPGSYGPPRGRLFLALEEEMALGCVGLRADVGATCEMKRLYVRPQARGLGLGRRLVSALLAQAKALGYARMVLDTLPSMVAARRLYASAGFLEVPPPRPESAAGRIFMEIDLSPIGPGQEAVPDE